MDFFRTLAVATAISAVAGASSAATVTSDSVILGSEDDGFSWFVDWEGELGGETLSATSTWTFDGEDGDTWSFSLDIENNSSDGARVTAWGFDSDPTAADFSVATSGWSSEDGQGVMNSDHCSSSNNCPGGGGGGILAGASQVFSFSFESGEDELTLDNFLLRLQSVGTSNELSTVLVGTPSPVPLPAAGWLLLGGLGGLAAMKRRRKS